MDKKKIYLGENRLIKSGAAVKGQFVDIQNEKFYKISNYHRMADFFMAIVSDTDHWMFLSSNGALSAGRKDRNNALFPYYSEDKIRDYKDLTGSKTCTLVEKNGKTYLWEPFTSESENIYRIKRNLYKSIYGNKIIFEEVNLDLEIGFHYGWYNSEKFGFIKKSTVSNLSSESLKIEVLDGIRNILPYGVHYEFQNEYSNLLDAYKKSELLVDSGLGIFSLSSIPVDRAEPSESLKATTVWSCGLETAKRILISEKQIELFRKGDTLETENDIRACRGAYFLNATLKIEKYAEQEWMIVSEINQDSKKVADLNHFIKTEKGLADLLKEDVGAGTKNLRRMASMADGIQMGNEELCYARHFSNTIFNVMRGGVFTDNYTIGRQDFRLFVLQTNKLVYSAFKTFLDEMPEKINYTTLVQLAEKNGNADLLRICYEYLPLSFSRRHGDPSRPWNQFSIETKNEDGSVKLNYQGNWRDIFQNWEALCLSFPQFVEGMICKFVNATTADGYNPYRITREGIDWECPDPADPWAYIGYWGDHQIIYLQKLLELSNEFHPEKIDSFLTREIFTYANVPYRIKSYGEIVKNPKGTMEFNKPLDDQVKRLAGQTGSDGRLLHDPQNELYRANFTEKILVTLLAKLCNFIPEGGIWLNTQRPEWNDANNALVGNGASMVTLYYMRRFLKFWRDRFTETSLTEISISEEIKALFDAVSVFFAQNSGLPEGGFSDADRRRFADYLGEAGSSYRNGIYENSFSGIKKVVLVKELIDFTNLTLEYMDQSIRVNKRDDGLYHAYNLISFNDHGVSIRYLYEMLEGQVGVLSSGYLSVEESLGVLNSLRESSLFRADQYSYLLYPDRQLARFTAKNRLPAKTVSESVLLSKLIMDNNSAILNVDVEGNYHFNGAFRNAEGLGTALDGLKSGIYASLVEAEKGKVLEIFEKVFDHQSFTGRSGAFYGYEGLGSIYWHMVSKLLLAAQECYFTGVHEGADPAVVGKIKDHCHEIKAGIGLYKSPELYGAFPTDPYSHTPGNSGARQPGMTGQVKEDILSRMGELGIHIKQGEIVFITSLFNGKELLNRDTVFEYFDLEGEPKQLILKKGQMGFTFCQVPIIFGSGGKELISVTLKNGQKREIAGRSLNREISSSIFGRTGEIVLVEFFTGNESF